MARELAPGALALVQRFVNTKDVEGDRDGLNKPDDLRAFLAESDVLASDARVSVRDLERARDVREALRSLLFHNTGEPLDPTAIEVLNANAGTTPLTVRFGNDGTPQLAPIPDGIDAAIARIVGIVFSAVADGSWVRLKACKRNTCRWAFYDGSKNGSSRWCSMEVCGCREKSKAYRRRKTTHA